MAPDEVTYETLKGRLYKERRAQLELTKLDADFYAQAERHLRELQDLARRELESNPGSPKAMVLQDELRNLNRVREDIYDLRERKILYAAQVAARGGNPDRGAMTAPELTLYEDLVRSLKEARRTMLKRTMPVDGPAALPPPPLAVALTEATLPIPPASVTPPAKPEAAVARPAEAAEAPRHRSRSGRVLIRPLEDLPAFTAPDLRTYRLRSGDLAAVPSEVAHALVAGGKAVLLESTA